MNTRVIVDTSIWIEFFRDATSALSLHLQALLRERRVFLVGMVLAEILQGVKSPKEQNLVRQNMNHLPYLEITREIWQKAGERSAALRRKGVTIPLSDLIIATSALTEGHEVFTADPHFNSIPELKLHQPS